MYKNYKDTKTTSEKKSEVVLFMSVSKKEYKEMTEKASPKSKSLKDCLKAFLIGGSICTFGEFLSNLYLYMGLTKDEASAFVSITLIVISAILTGLGIYEKIAKHAGAGTLVPITGFANSVVSPALEFKTEGYILGVGAKIFIISGPVILYGILSSSIYGIIYYFFLKG